MLCTNSIPEYIVQKSSLLNRLKSLNNDKDIDNILNVDDITCPITSFVISEPVVASDGHIYEKMAIDNWLVHRKTSPLTRELLEKQVYHCSDLKRCIDTYLAQHPEIKDMQFSSSTSHLDNIIIVNNLIGSGNFSGTFDGLLNFTNYNLYKIYEHEMLSTLLSKTNLDVIKHVMDNCDDLNTCVLNKLFLYSVFKYINSTTGEYIINKFLELNPDMFKEESGDAGVIRNICFNTNTHAFYFLMDKYVLSNDVTICNYSFLNCISQNIRVVDRLMYLIQKGFTFPKFGEDDLVKKILERSDSSKFTNALCFLEKNNMLIEYLITPCFSEKTKLIHMVCRKFSSNDGLIKYVVDLYIKYGLSAELESESEYKSRPIHFICQKCSLDVLKYLISVIPTIDINCENILVGKPTDYVISRVMDGQDMFKYLVELGADISPNSIRCICEHLSLNFLKIIVENRKANAKIYLEYDDGSSRPIHYACVRASETGMAIVKYLISCDIDVTAKNRAGLTALQLILKECYKTKYLQNFLHSILSYGSKQTIIYVFEELYDCRNDSRDNCRNKIDIKKIFKDDDIFATLCNNPKINDLKIKEINDLIALIHNIKN